MEDSTEDKHVYEIMICLAQDLIVNLLEKSRYTRIKNAKT